MALNSTLLIHLHTEDKEKLKSRANKKNMTMGELIRQLIRLYLKGDITIQ